MKIIDKYILKEILPFFFIGTFIFTFIILMNEFFRFTELVINKGLDISYVFRMIFLSLPFILSLSIPMSLLLGCLMGLSRLSNDYEIIAMKASGISIYTMLKPLLFLGFATFLFSSYIMLDLLPHSNHQFRSLRTQILFSRATAGLEEKIFNSDYDNILLWTDNITSDGIMEGLFISDDRDPESTSIILARTGHFITLPDKEEIILRLLDGSIHILGTEKKDSYDISTFERQDIRIFTKEDSKIDNIPKGIREMNNYELTDHLHFTKKTILEIKDQIKNSHTGILGTSPNQMENYQREINLRQKVINNIKLEFSKRFSLPFSCIIFVLLALPFGTIFSRGGKYSGIAVSLFLIIIFYVLFILGETLGKEGIVNPAFSIWTPNIIMGTIAIYLVYRSSIESNNTFIQKLMRPLEFIITRKKNQVIKRIHRDPFHYGENPVPIPQKVQKPGILMIIDKYIISQFLKVFIGVISISTVLFIVIDAFQIIDDVLRYQSGVRNFLMYIIFTLPTLLSYAIPFSTLLSILITIALFSRSNEIIAFKALGVSIYRLFMPVLAMALFLSLGLFALNEYITPQSHRKAREIRNFHIRMRDRHHSFVQNREWFHGLQNSIYYIDLIDPKNLVLHNLMIYNYSENFQMEQVIQSSITQYDRASNKWVFNNGWIRTFDSNGMSSYKTFDLKTDLPQFREEPEYFIREKRHPMEMNYNELKSYIERLEKGGYRSMDFLVSLNFKIAYPFVCLILAFISFPFGLIKARKGAVFFGVVISVLLGIIYWILLALFQSLGKAEMLPPVLSAWAANIIFLALGIFLLLNSDT